jgi:hypothetical protein
MALLEKMVHSYNMYGSLPLQVAGVDGGVEDANYQMQESKDLAQEVEDLKEVLTQLDSIQEQIDAVKLDISASKINGFAETIIIPQGQDELFVDWSNSYNPETTPTVLATLRSRNEEDPIVAYRLEGAVGLNGAKFVFSSRLPSNNYALEVAAFIID